MYKSFYNGIIKLILFLQGRFANTNLKIMLSIGGWTHASKGFNEASKDDKSMYV